jgi:DNA-3-methyladenine glycosylase I
MMIKSRTRCAWVKQDDALYCDYHDHEWGYPQHDDRKLFEAILLDTYQAGLSWLTVLRKRENFRKAFDDFDPKRIARYDDNKIEELMQDTGIIRNRLKIKAAITNAQAFLKLQKEYGTFDKYIWQFTNGKAVVNNWKSIKEIPPRTVESDAMSKSLVKNGFKFVGTTICYAFMQAVGMVDDHTIDCFRRKLK